MDRRLLTCAVFLCLAAAAGADTGYGSAYIGAFMNEGGAAKWLTYRELGAEHPAVAMSAEDVDIYLYADAAAVDARFTFINDGPAATIPMVYPLRMELKNKADCDLVISAREGGEWRRLPFDAATPGSSEDEGDYDLARFDLPFAAGETKEIRCTYRAPYGFYWEGYYAPLWQGGGGARYPGAEEGAGTSLTSFCPYVLSSGATWKGPIGRGRIAYHITPEVTWEHFLAADGKALVNGSGGCMDPNASYGPNFLAFAAERGIRFALEPEALVLTFEGLEPVGTGDGAGGLYSFENNGIAVAIAPHRAEGVAASSVLAGESGVSLKRPGNKDGVWAEGVAGDGVGEWLRLSAGAGFPEGVPYEGAVTLRGLHVYGGYHARPPRFGMDLFYQNGAPAAVTVAAALAGKEVFRRSYDLAKAETAAAASPPLAASYLDFGGPVKCDALTLTIEGARPGEKWADTCVSGVIPIPYDDRTHHRASTTLIETPADLARYHAAKVSDGKAGSCWAEGAAGAGAGEWLEMAWEKPRTVSGVEVLPGFASDAATWKANSRPAAIRLEFYRGAEKAGEQELALADEMTPQRFPLTAGEIDGVTRLRLTVEKITAGEKYQDTCISEVKVF